MGAKSGQEQVLFLRHPGGHWLVGEGPFSHVSLAPADRPAFYLPDFFLSDPKPWWVPARFLSRSAVEMKGWLAERRRSASRSAKSPVSSPGWSWQLPSQADFARDFALIQSRIASGEIVKAVAVVMARAERLPAALERWDWVERAWSAPSRWLAYGGWWDDGQEGLIGLSPEILFFAQPGWLETMALAGTARADAPDLLSSAKDRDEHRWVAEDIARQLSRFGTVKSTPTREWTLGRLKHLRTDLAVELTSGALPAVAELVAALHPTPAVGVAPRERGGKVLREISVAESRRRFGAPFAVHVPGELALGCVAIRGLQWHAGATWLASGCGVVEASQLDHEWQELNLKRDVVMEQFGVGL